MNLKYIVTGVNENERYLHCIPLFIASWKAINRDIQIKVVLFADEIPEFLYKFKKNICLIPPIENVSSAFCSQVVRLFYPCLLPNDGAVLISDVDLLPLRYQYFSYALDDSKEDKFVTFRANHMKKYGRPEVVMCYNAAYPKVWQSIFEVDTMDTMKDKLEALYQTIEYEDIHNGKGWRTDQELLFKSLSNWGFKDANHVELTDEELNFTRLNPGEGVDLNAACHWIRQGKAVDIHINKNLLFSSNMQQRKNYEQRVLSYIDATKELNH